MTNDKPERFSRAVEPDLVTDKAEIAVIEVKNALRQFDEGMDLVQKSVGSGRFSLRLSTIVTLNRAALQGVSSYAGVFRPGEIEIVGSEHKPITAELVPAEVERLCDYINENWNTRSALHLASYALWRINWIHPFVDGNGRTARIVSYVILCAKMGYRLPGALSIPEQIANDKHPYYEALEAADKKYSVGKIDVSALEGLLSELLANQLLEVHDDASQQEDADRRAFKTKRQATRQKATTLQWIESHPVLMGGMITLVVAILGIIGLAVFGQ